MKTFRYFKKLSMTVLFPVMLFISDAVCVLNVEAVEIETFQRYWEKTTLSLPENSKSSGTATYDIPVNIPPGRGGIAPKLAFTYRSARKNGWMGPGWDISVGEIRRSTKFGLDYNANRYEAVKDGMVIELEPRPDWGENYYGEKFQGVFSSKYYYEPAGKKWIVTSKEGIEYSYGQTNLSRQYDPNDETRIFKWCLDRIEDKNGNYLEASYATSFNEVYLDEIEYTGNSISNAEPANRIVFIREQRTDSYKIYKTHFAVTTSNRLKSLEVYGNGEFAGKYVLDYEQSASTKRSLLHSLTQYDGDDNALPPITFSYSEIDFEFNDQAIQWNANNEGTDMCLRFYYPIVGGYPPGYLIDNLDINGDGRIDRIAKFGETTYLKVYLNNGAGFNEDYIPWHTPELTNNSYHQWVRTTCAWATRQDNIDMDGDGLPDRVVLGNSTSLKVYKNTGNGFSSVVQSWPTPNNGDGWVRFGRYPDQS